MRTNVSWNDVVFVNLSYAQQIDDEYKFGEMTFS